MFTELSVKALVLFFEYKINKEKTLLEIDLVVKVILSKILFQGIVSKVKKNFLTNLLKISPSIKISNWPSKTLGHLGRCKRLIAQIFLSYFSELRT